LFRTQAPPILVLTSIHIGDNRCILCLGCPERVGTDLRIAMGVLTMKPTYRVTIAIIVGLTILAGLQPPAPARAEWTKRMGHCSQTPTWAVYGGQVIPIQPDCVDGWEPPALEDVCA